MRQHSLQAPSHHREIRVQVFSGAAWFAMTNCHDMHCFRLFDRFTFECPVKAQFNANLPVTHLELACATCTSFNGS